MKFSKEHLGLPKDKFYKNAFQTIKFMEFRHKMLLLFPEKVFFSWQE